MALKPDVVLTADRTLMSNYHRNEFLGFAASAPPKIIPEQLFKIMFFPPIKTKEGIPYEAPYALRKIEAQLMSEGFDVLTVDPDHLGRYLDNAKALAVTTMDPFGLGPSSTTLAKILKKGDPYLARYFRLLLEKPEVKKAKKRGLKIIVGGPGAWQFKHKPGALERFGIDSVIDGEAEKIIGDLFRKALRGEDLPQLCEVGMKDIPTVQEIPEIQNPSVNGLIEIGRGCCRGCAFCEVTTRPLRWYPYEKIEKELRVNVNAGVSGAVLHSEDVLLYGSRNTIPNREKVTNLLRLSKKVSSHVSWSHVSMASISADPKLVHEVGEILIDEKQDYLGAEIGIETGSSELLKKAMPAKAHPFKPEEWPTVVKNAAGLMGDNNIVPACTLIVGLPQETENDVLKTIELLDDLKGFKSLIVPLFFIPLGRLKDKDWFEAEQMSGLHRELLYKCLNHDLKWLRLLVHDYFKGTPYRSLLIPLYRFFIRMAEYKARSLEHYRALNSES